MASFKAQRATFPQPMRVDGTGVNIVDKYVFTATNPAAADTIDFRMPAGSFVTDMKFFFDDVDTGVTFVVGVGYRPVDTNSLLAPSTIYFAPAGQTTGQTGGVLVCGFKPIKFEEDVFIQMLIGTGTTGVNTGKEIWMIADINAVGPI